jgi:hypothetical protein
MRNLNRSLFLLAFIGILGLPLFGWGNAEVIKPFGMPATRAGAMGGTHAALADDFYTLFTNPAGLAKVEQEFSFAELSASAYGPTVELVASLGELADLFGGGSSGDGSSESAVPEIPAGVSDLLSDNGGLAWGLNFGGPIALGYVGRGLGLGLFNRTQVDLAVPGTQIKAGAAEDILLVGGYGFNVLDLSGHTLDVGFLGKGFFRVGMNSQLSFVDIANIGGLLNDMPLKTYMGLGVDVGARYTFANFLSAGLVFYDLYTPALVSDLGGGTADPGYGAVLPRLDLGVAYNPGNQFEFLNRFLTGLVVTLDYHDFLDLAFSLIPRNPVLNIGVGVEAVLLNIVSVRLGIADALPAVGLGLDLSIFKLDLAMHGKELGLDPGDHSTYEIDLGLLFRY